MLCVRREHVCLYFLNSRLLRLPVAISSRPQQCYRSLNFMQFYFKSLLKIHRLFFTIFESVFIVALVTWRACAAAAVEGLVTSYLQTSDIECDNSWR